MEQWDQDFVDEEEEGYFEFESKDFSQLHFGYVHGQMDCRFTTRDGKPTVEFSWEGNDEMDQALGRGWATIESDQIEGMLFFHGGDSSAFRAKRTKQEKTGPRR
jgi:hypothetical protein